MEEKSTPIAISCCLLFSAMIAGMLSFSYFMEPVTSDLGFDRSAFPLYITALTLMGMITLPLYGRLVGRFGARKVVLVAAPWTALCIAGMALCDHLIAFYAMGALAGLGFFGSTYAVVPVVAASWFLEKSSLVMGAASAVGGSGVHGV